MKRMQGPIIAVDVIALKVTLMFPTACVVMLDNDSTIPLFLPVQWY